MRVSETADDFTFTTLFSDFEEIYENRRNDKFDNLVKNIKSGKIQELERMDIAHFAIS